MSWEKKQQEVSFWYFVSVQKIFIAIKYYMKTSPPPQILIFPSLFQSQEANQSSQSSNVSPSLLTPYGQQEEREKEQASERTAFFFFFCL